MTQLTFLGCGDAFGSGGRLNTCFHVRDAAGAFLIDCGATAMVAIRKFGVEPNAVRAILITHLHGDHFGGLPFFILDAQLVSRRTAPLVVAGPPGLKERLTQAMEAFFPGSSGIERRFALDVVEIEPGGAHEIAGLTVRPFVVRHPSGAPSTALRVSVDGKTLCYSGDTEWVDALGEAAKDADLFIAEAYFFDRRVKFHLDFATLAKELPGIGARRVVLTHMSPDMLARVGETGCGAAEDGLTLSF